MPCKDWLWWRWALHSKRDARFCFKDYISIRDYDGRHLLDRLECWSKREKELEVNELQKNRDIQGKRYQRVFWTDVLSQYWRTTISIEWMVCIYSFSRRKYIYSIYGWLSDGSKSPWIRLDVWRNCFVWSNE